MKTVEAAVIGVGWIGGLRADTLSRTALVDKLHLCDIKPDRLAEVTKLYKPATSTLDYQDIINNEKISVVYVSTTPEANHYPIARDCLRSGKNVMLEKPIALELWEADELIQLAKRNNLKFTIGYSQRFNPKIAYAKKKIVDGTLGKVVSVLVSRHLSRELGKKIASRVRLSPVVMKSTHDLDFVFWLLEPAKPVRVYSQGAYGYMQPVNGSHDIMFTTVTMDNGVVVMIGGGWNFPPSYPNYCSTWIEITGTDGALTLDDTQRDNWLNTEKRGQEFPMSTMPGEWVDHVFAGGIGPETIHFLEACIRDTPVMVTPESARRVMETYSAADLSADRNEPVDLPLTNETISGIAELKAKNRAGLERMKKNAKGIGLAIIGAGRVGLFRGEVAARHPAVEWIGIAELNHNRGGDVAARIGADFVTTSHRELLARPEVTAVLICHRRASARRSDPGGGRARPADADRKAARHRSRPVRPRAQSHHRRQARRHRRLHPALPPQMARRQGEGAHRRARRRHHGDLARLHESAGRHRQLQAHRRSDHDLADGDLRHARARHRHVVPRRQAAGRMLRPLGRQGAGAALSGHRRHRRHDHVRRRHASITSTFPGRCR